MMDWIRVTIASPMSLLAAKMTPTTAATERQDSDVLGCGLALLVGEGFPHAKVHVLESNVGPERQILHRCLLLLGSRPVV